jgi:HK97 family phage major capsid protein
MSPKTVGAFTDYSRKLLLQSSIDVENFVRNDLAAVIALELDRVALYGSGASNQPTGLKALLAGGNQEKNFAAATPTFAEVISLETAVTSANGDIGSMAYILNASMRGALKAAQKVSGYPSFIMESDGSMNGYSSLVSNQAASGDVLFGVWSQLIMALLVRPRPHGRSVHRRHVWHGAHHRAPGLRHRDPPLRELRSRQRRPVI